MTQREQVLAVVTAGPATTRDVMDETGLPMKHACAYLRTLWQEGILDRRPLACDAGGRVYVYNVSHGT